MTLDELIDKYFQFLWDAFQYDMNVFIKPWMYIPLLIPIIFYVSFFVIKWVVLLTPILIPLRKVLNNIEYILKY